MLNLSRYEGQMVEMEDGNGLMIKVKVIKVDKDGRVLLGFHAPDYINIVRTEIKRTEGNV